MSWADAWPSREDQRATTLAMKLGGRRLVARRHSGVDVGVCGDGYRQIRPSVAGSCLALACGRRRGGGEGVSPPWRRSAGASVMPSCGTTPVSQNPDCHLKVVLESCERGRFSQSRMLAAARRGALTARACTRTPSSRACRCAQSMRSWCCNSAALRPHRSPASPPSVVPLPPAPPPADAVVRALSGSRPRGGGSSVGPGRAARLEDGTPTRVPILSFCSFLPVSRLCRETAECVPS